MAPVPSEPAGRAPLRPADGAAAGRGADLPETAVSRLDVPVGRRVMVVSDLLLTPAATPTTTAVTAELVRALDTWDGPGILVVAGNLFDLIGADDCSGWAEESLDAHPALAPALRRFLAEDGRRVVRQLGDHESRATEGTTRHDHSTALAGLGVEQVGPLDLHLRTGTGWRVVRVEQGGCTGRSEATASSQAPSPTGAGPVGPPSVSGWRRLLSRPEEDAPWLDGANRLSDPAACGRFVSSRILYRRLGRHVWWLLVPFAAAIVVRIGVTPWLLGRAGTGLPGRALRHAHRADLGDQLAVAIFVAAVVFAVLAVVLWLLSRRAWTALGGGALDAARDETAANDAARDAGRQFAEQGYAGLVTAATFEPELTHLGVGFYANVGASTEVVEEHGGRLGLPPVFVATQQVSWIELETGAELHVRLMLGRRHLPSPSRLESLAAGRVPGILRPELVASYPSGESWPPAPDLRRAHRRTRRVRRWASAAILLAGVIDLLDAVTPPLRGRLHFVLEYLPLRATVAAGALVAVAGLGLIALGRGILRGQRRAWLVAVPLLSGTVVLHLIAGADVEESVMALLVLTLLVTNRREFRSASDWSSLNAALAALLVGWISITLATVASLEVLVHFRHHHPPPFWSAVVAVSERMIGIQTVALPERANRFLAPTLLAIGLTVIVLTLFLLTRPVVDRRLRAGRAAELRARDIVRRHGSSTLDYFALRADKRWFFHRDSVVAYAVHGGICLISPDPIGPRSERTQVWAAFRRYADSHGWVTAVMGSGDDWLPVYRESGMHHVYLGDEAVVHAGSFNLAGRSMKGLRQAHHRVQRKGYTASFFDPARLDRRVVTELARLMDLSRQGEQERGFSMMLGRIFDPRDTGLLLTVVRSPDGRPAAMCQFVPAPGIKGFSLDLMRRDPADHPNGLLDFALCETIEHLRARGFDGLSLNFAAMRSTLAGERGDGTVQRAERWLLKRMSNMAQIESLWRFNAKYEPEWLPRYVVFDTAEHLVPVVMAILRAESIWEVPVLGRLLAASAGRRSAASRDGDLGPGGPRPGQPGLGEPGLGEPGLGEPGLGEPGDGQPGELTGPTPTPDDEIAVRR